MKNMAHIDEHGKVINISVHGDDVVATESLVPYTDDNPAWIGGDLVGGFFYPPQPFPSWTRANGEWVAPVPRPESGPYFWDEDSLSWIRAQHL